MAVDKLRFWDVPRMASCLESQAEGAALWQSHPHKSERLNQSHTLTFKALAWTDGMLPHIPLLCTSHMAKPNISIARKYVHPHPRQDGNITYHNHQHHFAVYIFSEFAIYKGVCTHIHIYFLKNEMTPTVKFLVYIFWWISFYIYMYIYILKCLFWLPT